MALNDILATLAAAWLDQQKTKIYGPNYKVEQAAAKDAATQRALSLTELSRKVRGAPEMEELTRRGKESEIGLQGAQMEQARAHAEALRNPQPKEQKPLHQTRRVGQHTLDEYLDPSSLDVLKSYQGDVPPRGAGEGDPSALAGNPYTVTDAQGKLRRAARTKGGKEVFVDTIGGEPAGPAPTVQERNDTKLDTQLPVSLDQLQANLNNVKNLGWTGAVASFVPGTTSHRVEQLYERSLNGLSVILAKGLGEQRPTDEDRVVYRDFMGVFSKFVATPPGEALAQELLDQMKNLATQFSWAKQVARTPYGATPPPKPPLYQSPETPGGGSGVKMIQGVPYAKGSDGLWHRQKNDATP